MQLEELKEKVKLTEYVQQQGGQVEKAGQNVYRINPCPVCGHKDHFTVYPENNSYYSFSGCCEGGSIIDYMIEIEGLNKTQAISRVKQLAGAEREKLPGPRVEVRTSRVAVRKEADQRIAEETSELLAIRLVNILDEDGTDLRVKETGEPMQVAFDADNGTLANNVNIPLTGRGLPDEAVGRVGQVL